MAGHLRVGAERGSIGGAFCPWILALTTSCLQIGLPDGTDGGALDAAKRSDGDAPSDVKAPDKGASSDLGCVIDPLSRVTLCTAIGLCPGLSVDHDRFPNCGFRAGTGVIDVQCFCGDFLCPLGATLTCGQARDLLATQFELTACSQVNEGRCARRSIAPPTGTSCDKNCAAMCAGDPGCLRFCGC
jgi:hypothetical protein